MIACTHHAAFWCVVETSVKAFAALRLSMNTIYKLQASFLLTKSHVLSLGLRTHWSKSVKSSDCAWSHRKCRISCITTLVSLGNVLSLRGYLRQNWPCKHFMQHFATSLSDWYLPSEEWCTRVKTHSLCTCLKSSTQIWTFPLDCLLLLVGRDYNLSKLYVRSVIRGEKAFRQDEQYVESFSSIAEVLLLAIRILLQRLAGCC